MIEESAENPRETPLQTNPENKSKEPWEREVNGMHIAMHFIHKKARGEESGGLDRDDLFLIHKFVMNDPFNPEKTGVLRKLPVIVRGIIKGEVKVAAFEPEDITFLSEHFNEFAHEFEQNSSGLNTQSTVSEVIDLASEAHKRFIEIHPFEDGNGRTARLLVDFTFRKARLPYIKNWGAQRHEYDEIVYRIYSENNLSLLKLFLAKKLKTRLEEINNNFFKDDNSSVLKEYLGGRLEEVNNYIKDLENIDAIKAS